MKILGDVGAGHVLGRYELLMPIASGGMATVWAARMKGSRGFQKIVAVKTMLPSMSDDPEFEQMFLDEAALASSIRHPNIAEILDLGEENGILFLVMEWVDGEPLSVVMKSAAKRGKEVPMAVAVRIVSSLCAGLHAAHELRDEAGSLLGVVHRDVSPQNVLVTFDGVVKVVDFGVAKAVGRSSTQTTAGQVKGKAAYMSPEQAQGAPIDRRTDVFAVGILLYQLTTGKHPFRAENEVATLYNICAEEPVAPPSTYAPSYPRSLELIVERALAKRADERYATASELGRALEGLTHELGTAGDEEVAAFVRDLLGERQDKRNETLKIALRLADDRVDGSSRRSSDLEGISHTGFTPVSTITPPGGGVVTDPEATAPNPGLPAMLAADLAQAAPAGKALARWRALAVALAILGVAIGIALVRRSLRARWTTPLPDSPSAARITLEAGPSTSPAAAESPSTVAEGDLPLVRDTPAASSTASSQPAVTRTTPGRGSAAGRTSTPTVTAPRQAPARTSTPFVAPVRNPGF